MREQVAIQRVLLNKFEELRSKNPLFSQRAFSIKLGLSSGAISELLNGKRKVSMRLAERIATRLSLDPQERSELFGFFPDRVGRFSGSPSTSADPNYLRLSADQFRVIGDWYHFAILALMRTRDFRSDVAWIAERFGLNQAMIRTALERLKRLDIVQEDENGKLTRSPLGHCTPDDVSNASIRLAHFEALDKARHALETLPVKDRDFTVTMLTMSPSQLPRVKEMIRKFQDELAAEIEAIPESEVYQLCIQLYPLTRVRNEEGESS